MLSKEKFFELLETKREDNSWDFKEELKLKPNEKFYDFLKDVLAFSNSGGGYLLLGVRDGNLELVNVNEKLDVAQIGAKMETTLGFSVDIKILYFEHELEGENITLGIIYIPESESIILSPKDLTNGKGAIVQANSIYVRRNTRSIVADREGLERLINRVNKKGEYKFKKQDLEIIERNKEMFSDFGDRIYNHLKGDYVFSTNEFSYKLDEVYRHQVKFNKLEFAKLIGFEEEQIDAFFEGRAFPSLEHILRITTIFELPPDYFFRSTIYSRYPLWQRPMISYCILDKVKEKRTLFSSNEGEFFSDVFWQLARHIRLFGEWMSSSRPKKGIDPLEKMFSEKPSDYLYEYNDHLNNKELNGFKSHLSHQYYKILEVFKQISRDTDLNREEAILNFLMQSRDEFICRIINESIKEIELVGKEAGVTFHFIDEIVNKKVNGREYNSKTLELQLKKIRKSPKKSK
ncbi:ATP-binding protein [Bacillus cereus]|uniref:ATP-binding protein n=1 Tax=Bacillus cereus TaxID=1396 RepID=UPI000BF41549|nr:ATP-binding protein [Bacillus cereus]PFK30759.1 ATP-binding protein [Bacillus cereus]